MEVYKNLPEGTLAELINSVLYMSPSPTYKHQKVLQLIARKLYEVVDQSDLGEVIISPFDVYLDEDANAVQPDIIVVLNKNLKLIREDGYFHGVPDIIIEILSDGNRNNDLIRKMGLYERFGVCEYFIVDPVSLDILGYSLIKGKYHLATKEKGILNSKLIGNVINIS